MSRKPDSAKNRPLSPQHKKLNDLELMNNYDEWPRWPLLPLKRMTGEGPLCGFIVAENTVPVKVYLASIFSLKAGPLGEVLAPLKFYEYPDYWAVAQEWKVD